MISLQSISKPSLLLNETICRRNISKMVEKSLENRVILRPHFKSHGSAEVGEWFREAGINAITVSSVSMASFFEKNDWDDITIAFPVNTREIADINDLAGKIRLNLLVENIESTFFLGDNISSDVGIFLKIDTGYHRTGIDPLNHKLTGNILEIIDRCENLNFKGFLTHAGHSYKVNKRDDILKIHKETVEKLNRLKNLYIERYPGLILSSGDTPTCSVSNDFSGLDEIRPGNFALYDLMQANIGSCDYKDIAAAVACPVVAKHEERQEIVIYGGAVHISKEHYILSDGTPCFGLIVEPLSDGWSDPVEGVWLSSLSQEHGIIRSENKLLFNKIKVGDMVLVLPVHSCLTFNLLKEFIPI